MKTSLKNYYLFLQDGCKVVLAKNIKEVRKHFPNNTVLYSGPLTENELFLGIDRIRGQELAPQLYINRLYEYYF